MKYLLILLLGITCIFSFLSCEDGDDFSSDPNLRVEFSNDTVSFDTVFTSFGSSTKLIKVYNRNKKSLNISSVEIMNPETSGFRMNVDGFAGNRVENVELFKEDSLFIYLEVTVDPSKSNDFLFIRDSIRFNINGSMQYVQLEAIGQNAEVWCGGRIIEQDTTLIAGKPLIIYDSIYVKKGATLNIEKNVKIHFHDKAKIIVDGRINAKGTLDEPIVFRADRLDNLFTFVPYDRVPGQWEGIIVDSISFDNYFEHVHIRNAVNAIKFKKSDPSIKKATFVSSIVHNSAGNGIYAEDCWIEAKNSLFTNAYWHTLNLIGGQYEFTHCTIANHYAWRNQSRKGKALALQNTIKDENGDIIARNLLKADFINCIITGQNSYGEIVLDINENVNSTIPYLFKNCILKARGEDDSNFVNIVWGNPMLKKTDPYIEGVLPRKEDYLFIFELDSISPAIDVADRQAASALPVDIRGVSRLSDSGPDIGCYEWVGSEEKQNIYFSNRKKSYK